MKNVLKGLTLTFVGGLLILFIFYGKILRSPNQYYFSPGGDGLKAYAGAVYHVEYDTSMYRMDAMNYPYGEMVNFTGSQPVITNTIRRIDKLTGIDFSDSVVGIMNVLMLFSILLGAVFLFLIFSHVQCQWWYASLAALGIIMLSPQIDRLGGHFSLSYMVWLPAIIWLFLKYDEKRNWRYAIFISVIVYLASAMHLYFFGFFGFVVGVYWLYRFVSEKGALRSIKNWLHFFIQLILPFVALQLIIYFNDSVVDRTTHPWGFFSFKAQIAAIFLPLREPYTRFLQSMKGFPHYEWETYAFIGMVALVGFLVGFYFWVKRVIKSKSNFFKVTDFKLFNVLFWASVTALIFSFALPFSLGLEWLLEYLTPIRQLRALARFSWLFFYMINILVFYGIYKYFLKNRKKGGVVMVIALAFLFYDGYLNVSSTNKFLQNKIPELFDVENLSPENQWIHKINTNDYQAILPLPYFHVGSESIWIEAPCGILKQSFIMSMKTGMPSMGTMLSRTSLSQTYKSVQLVTQPYNHYKILDDMPNQKPLLVVAAKNCNELKETEKNIINKSQFLFTVEPFSYYKLELDSLKVLPFEGKKAYKEALENIIRQSKLPDSGYVYENFDNLPATETQQGKGAFQGIFNENNVFFEFDFTGGVKDTEYIVRFWVKDYQKDLYARSNIEIRQFDENNQIINTVNSQIFRKFVRLDNDWVQVEIPIKLSKNNPKITMALINGDLRNKAFSVDELSILPMQQDNYTLYREKEIERIKNDILNSDSWLNAVKQNAEERNIPLDSMLTLDAIYMFENL